MSAFSPEITAKALIPKDLLSQASSLHFSVHIGSQTIEATLSEASGGDFHWVEKFELETSEYHRNDVVRFLRERNWSERVFRKCTISFDATVFTLVPIAFFQAEKASELLEFSTGKQCGEVSFQEISEWDAVLIWEEPEYKNELTGIFPNARLFPSAYLVLKNGKVSVEKSNDTIVVLTTARLMTMVIYQKGTPVLLNTHAIQGPEDVLYFASHAAMTLNIDFEFCAIQSWSETADIELIRLFKQYNRNVTPLYPDSKAGYISNLHVLCV